RGEYAYIDFAYYQDYDLPLPDERYSKRWASHVPVATLCTEYWEEYFTTYYTRSNTTQRIRDGIAQPMTYSVQPAPDHRYIEKHGTSNYTVVSQCVPKFRGQCTTSSDAPHG